MISKDGDCTFPRCKLEIDRFSQGGRGPVWIGIGVSELIGFRLLVGIDDQSNHGIARSPAVAGGGQRNCGELSYSRCD